jgi:ABC-2 type transport system ATP-binding protein
MTGCEPAIVIRGLTKDYRVGFARKRSVRALDHLTLEVRRGEIFGFLGPNGAGKTTTLKLLMGLIYPTEGTAYILGHRIDTIEARSQVGYLPENPYFYDYLSGRELLTYTAALFGMSGERARQRIDQMLRLVGLCGEPADLQLRKYSKGMLQRIGIAQALINDPEVIFMDEPMSGLDPIGRREVRDLLLALREQGKTIFFSSHILSDVEALCDRAAILVRGRIMRCGSVQELTGADRSSLEMIAIGVDHTSFAQITAACEQVQSVTATPNGVRLILSDESGVEEALELVRRSGGRLISINPARASLEELFLEAGKPEQDRS